MGWPDSGDGLVDLRGLAVGREGLQIRYLTLARTDFSHTRGRLSFFESELSDCRFDTATLSSQARFDRSFERCSFRAAALRGFSIGRRVVDCDFTDADARKCRSLPNTRFERCHFTDTDLSWATFADTTFDCCIFDGAIVSGTTSFTRCTFRATHLEFGRARVNRCTSDGHPLPDRWTGEMDAQATVDALAERYAATVAVEGAGDLSLDL
ncbi:uncharacterized protein YjbI with pentapeptide repeats [Rhodococcus sp. 27YEA15]|uniref:pentapeptide repeat-containing protein n=1 Tax=Rhodococcus sp. 27YEA15 TaxID=3156259 RepID=UPI003C7E4DCF